MASQQPVPESDPAITALPEYARPQALRLREAMAKLQKTRAVVDRQLDAIDRELAACVAEGLSYSEIGRIIGISKQAVHVRYSKLDRSRPKGDA